jgi:undecaprenyl diphosphate synthase
MSKEYFNKLDHLAIIMDGNGRWAKSKNLERIFGHKVGLENISNIVEHSIKNNIKYLTLFAFSTENFYREKNEVDNLVYLFDYALDEYKKFIFQNNLIFRCIGDISFLPQRIKEKVFNLEKDTSSNKSMTLIIAFNYGGRSDILNSVKSILKKITTNQVEIDNINEEILQGYLYTSNIPDPDLLIRTGGQKRLSNFLLWQLAYTELFFCDDYWPDFNGKKLDMIIEDYFLRKRNFGKI